MAKRAGGGAGPADGTKTVATNRKARHEYFIERTLEAGLVLTGSEVKSMRAGRVSLQEAYVAIRQGEAWLIGAHIAPYDQAHEGGHEPLRRRKLLLQRRQLQQAAIDVDRKGFTLVPLRLYFRGGWAKLEIGIAHGKKQHDKREALRERQTKREVERALARRDR